jgi:hypothetical protein
MLAVNPDVILMDIQLPGMSGVTSPDCKDLPTAHVIMLTVSRIVTIFRHSGPAGGPKSVPPKPAGSTSPLAVAHVEPHRPQGGRHFVRSAPE